MVESVSAGTDGNRGDESVLVPGDEKVGGTGKAEGGIAPGGGLRQPTQFLAGLVEGREGGGIVFIERE